VLDLRPIEPGAFSYEAVFGSPSHYFSIRGRDQHEIPTSGPGTGHAGKTRTVALRNAGRYVS